MTLSNVMMSYSFWLEWFFNGKYKSIELSTLMQHKLKSSYVLNRKSVYKTFVTQKPCPS